MIFMKDGEKNYLDYCKQIKFVRMEDVFREIQTYKTDNFKAVIEMGRVAIKASLYVQCGAVLAILAFFSNNLMEVIGGEITQISFLEMYVNSMYCWSFGIVLCVISYGTTYLSQYYDYQNYCAHSEELKHAVINGKNYTMPVRKIAYRFQCASVFLVCVSYVTMFVGLVCAASGMNLLLNY